MINMELLLCSMTMKKRLAYCSALMILNSAHPAVQDQGNQTSVIKDEEEMEDDDKEGVEADYEGVLHTDVSQYGIIVSLYQRKEGSKFQAFMVCMFNIYINEHKYKFQIDDLFIGIQVMFSL